MRQRIFTSTLLLATAVLAGCQGNPITFRPKAKAPEQIAPCDPAVSVCPAVQTPDEDTPRPKYRVGDNGTGEGFVEGVEAARLDETTEAEKTAALKTGEVSADKQLGRTIASLGDVSQQGFWLKTPLVIAARKGRVVWADNGNAVNVILIPKQGAATAGSQISLAAMRALGIPLT
ncbi:MAG: hypothetical protein GXP03_03350, partial [Alphaproteobacteria bacterium]|nr:hypothetical protein [Alphaproteobacteria bacterium]